MVLGKKYDIDADVMYQKIIKVEENIVNIQKKLVEVRIPALILFQKVDRITRNRCPD